MQGALYTMTSLILRAWADRHRQAMLKKKTPSCHKWLKKIIRYWWLFCTYYVQIQGVYIFRCLARKCQYTEQAAFSDFSSTECLKAETLWALFCVDNHISCAANDDTNKIFRRMFPTCTTAQGFQCGPNKLSYMVNFGLAPYFSDALRSSVGKNEYVLLFDESLNRATHKNKWTLISAAGTVQAYTQKTVLS